LALEPVDGVTAGGDARAGGSDASADAKGHRDLRMTTTDKFLAEAAREYQEGRVDQVLWRRAADQCGGDASLMIAAYLRSRATAMQLQQKEDSRSQIQARGAGSKRRSDDARVEAEPHRGILSAGIAAVRLPGVNPKVMYAAAAVAALASMVAVVYLIVAPRGGESVRPPIASAATPSTNPSASPTPLSTEKPGGGIGSGGTRQRGPDPTLPARVQQLKTDGQWNVLVPHAIEWTRQDPGNAAAWSELGIGYAKLRQYGDALDAATKAAQLSPGDSLLWRNLGQLNLDLDRLPEARDAFDRALAVNPDDVEALCGAALVAHKQGRPKDAEAGTRRVQSLNGTCPGVKDGESTPVPVAGTTTRKPAAAAGR
jgi:tetratricopeptide (TPR) repeat protein